MEQPTYMSVILWIVFVIGWLIGILGAFIDWFSLITLKRYILGEQTNA